MNKWLIEVIDSRGRVISHEFVYAKTLEEARNLGQRLIAVKPAVQAAPDVYPGSVAEEKSKGRARGSDRVTPNWRPQGRWRVPGPAYDNARARIRVHLVRKTAINNINNTPRTSTPSRVNRDNRAEKLRGLFLLDEP